MVYQLIQIASGVGFASALLVVVRHFYYKDTGDIADDIAWARSQHERIDEHEHGRDA